MSFRVGETVGPYRIVSLLGTGGVGRVFKVKHSVTGRVEAMKVLLKDYTASSEQTKRFRREIQLQARLQHPNIASVHNALWVQDTLVMIILRLTSGPTSPYSPYLPQHPPLAHN